MSETETTEESTPVVTFAEAKERYEIHLGEERAGFATATPAEGDRLVFAHTVIDPAFGGRGLGKILVGEALADVARRGLIVVPECPFVVKYLQENEVAGLIIDWPVEEDAIDAASPGEHAG